MADTLDSMEQSLKLLVAHRDTLQQAIDPLQRQIVAITGQITDLHDQMHQRVSAAASNGTVRDALGNVFALGALRLADGNLQITVNGKDDGTGVQLEVRSGGVCYATNAAGEVYAYVANAWVKQAK